ISRPSTMIFSGASAPRAPVTRISKCTVSPSVASELFKTAVTLGESACANCAVAIIPKTAIKIRPGVDILKCILQASFRAESRKVSYVPLHPLPEMVRGFHFLLRPGSAILQPALLLAMVKPVHLAACRRPEREKESRQAAAVFFAARSSPGLDRFFAVADLS